MSDRAARTAPGIAARVAIVLLALAALVTSACAPPPPPPPPGDGVGAGRACSTAGRAADGDGVTTTVLVNGSPIATDATAAVGDVVEVTLSWDPAAFGAPALQAVDCVYLDDVAGHTLGRGTRLKELESIEQPLSAAAAIAGRWSTRYTVPARAAGALLCDRGRVVGAPPALSSVVGTEASRAAEAAPERRILRSDEVCLRIAGGPDPVIPELPLPFLSVLLTLVGVGLVTVRLRRRATTAS